MAGCRVTHDPLDAPLQIRSGHAGDTRTRRLEVQAARRENRPGVQLRFAAGLRHVLVARALALVDEPRADPPDDRMEPEQRLHGRLDRGDEVVAASHVRDLVRQDGEELLVAQVRFDRARPEQYGTEDAEGSRLEAG